MSVVIKVENVAKQYRLGQVGTGTLSHDLNQWFCKIRGKEDPYLKVGDANDRTTKSRNNDVVWALKDINFEVNQGQILGIIGKNGAGKSTLLKILSQITQPTLGQIKIKGKIASLLEVGTGFHPELSGRENIYLNGAILGMSKQEIKNKFDEIIDFSGVGRYIDTPVKRYSSGMYVRLAFAVAAHLEPDILIIDEVLAVGDAEFQKKCLGKMKDVSIQGRTVLFVSHNMAAVKELCDCAILLNNGTISYHGKTNAVLREYLSSPVTISSTIDLIGDNKSRRGNGHVRFSKITINDGDSIIDPQKEIEIKMKAFVSVTVDKIYFSMLVKNPKYFQEAITNTGLINICSKESYKGSIIEFNLKIPPNTFRTGLFPLYLWLGKKGTLAEENYPFDVVDSVYYLNIQSDKSKDELGYNTEEPGGYFNFEFTCENKNHISYSAKIA